MKAATIIRNTAKEFYSGKNIYLYNDRLKSGDANCRNIKVRVSRVGTPSVDFFRECLSRLRAVGYTARMNPLEFRIWVKQG
jgi:hypothetical protein